MQILNSCVLLFSLPTRFSQPQKLPALHLAITAVLLLCHAKIASITIHTSPAHGQHVGRGRIILLRFLPGNRFYGSDRAISWKEVFPAPIPGFEFVLPPLVLVPACHTLQQFLLPQKHSAYLLQRDISLRSWILFWEWE